MFLRFLHKNTFLVCTLYQNTSFRICGAILIQNKIGLNKHYFNRKYLQNSLLFFTDLVKKKKRKIKNKSEMILFSNFAPNKILLYSTFRMSCLLRSVLPTTHDLRWQLLFIQNLKYHHGKEDLYFSFITTGMLLLLWFYYMLLRNRARS